MVGIVALDQFPRRSLRDNADRREGFRISGVSTGMVGMPMGVDQIMNGLIRPLANLRDVFARAEPFPAGNTTVIVGDRDVLVVDRDLPSSAREDIAQIRQWVLTK